MTLTEHVVHEVTVRAGSKTDAIAKAGELWASRGPGRFTTIEHDVTDWNAAAVEPLVPAKSPPRR